MPIIRAVLRTVSARPWLTATVVVVAAGTATGYFLLTDGSGASSASAATTARTVAVTTGTVSKSISTTGDFAPAVDKTVSFSSSATVTSVRVSQGQRVRKGQILGTINNLSLKATLAEQRSSLATARSTLSTAEDDDDTTSAQLAADKAQVTTAKQAVTSAKSDLSDAVLRSPVAGIVATVGVKKGDQSSGGSSGSSGSASGSSSSSGDFEIISTSKWKVSVDVDDTEIGLISKGQQAQLTTDNHSGTIFGLVTAVSVLSSSDSGAATYPVVVTVTGSPSGLHDGAEATVKIIYKQATNVLTVPSLALHRAGNSTYVYRSSDGMQVKQTVKIGITDGTTTQIVSGLKSGEEVYEQVVRPSSTSGGSAAESTQSTSNQMPGGSGGSGGGPGGSGSGPGFGGGGGGS